MLLPYDIHPESSIYYNGAVILKLLKQKGEQKILELYANIKEEYDMTFSLFVLSLDWLYLIDAAKIDNEGIIRRCS